MDRVRQKLVTQEDPYYIHKILGLGSLLSFLYRYGWVWPTQGHLGLGNDTFSQITIATHTLLSSSALIFRVPAKRIYRQPTTIWREYLLHAIVFTWRCSLLYLLLAWTAQPTPITRGMVVGAMHVAADIISHLHGEPHKTTVRGDHSRKPRMWLVQKLSILYALYQFLALASHLSPHPRGQDLAFNALIAIQSSSFCMTLNRKGLIHWQTHAIVYTLCLALSGGYIAQCFWGDTLFFLRVAGVFLLRTQLGLSKYLLWPLFLAT